jgi:hypothetical protein
VRGEKLVVMVLILGFGWSGFGENVKKLGVKIPYAI